jgi:hypothetical protein
MVNVEIGTLLGTPSLAQRISQFLPSGALVALSIVKSVYCPFAWKRIADDCSKSISRHILKSLSRRSIKMSRESWDASIQQVPAYVRLSLTSFAIDAHARCGESVPQLREFFVFLEEHFPNVVELDIALPTIFRSALASTGEDEQVASLYVCDAFAADSKFTNGLRKLSVQTGGSRLKFVEPGRCPPFLGLTELTLSEMLPPSTLSPSTCNTLRSLQMDIRDENLPGSFNELFSPLVHLTTLSLGLYFPFSLSTASDLASCSLPCLESFSLTVETMNAASLEEVREAKWIAQLLAFHLHVFQSTSADIVPMIARMRELRCLSLTVSSAVLQPLAEYAASDASLLLRSRLEHLSIVVDGIFLARTAQWPALRSLHIVCPDSMVSAHHLLTYFDAPNLEKYEAAWCAIRGKLPVYPKMKEVRVWDAEVRVDALIYLLKEAEVLEGTSVVPIHTLELLNCGICDGDRLSKMATLDRWRDIVDLVLDLAIDVDDLCSFLEKVEMPSLTTFNARVESFGCSSTIADALSLLVRRFARLEQIELHGGSVLRRELEQCQQLRDCPGLRIIVRVSDDIDEEQEHVFRAM